MVLRSIAGRTLSASGSGLGANGERLTPARAQRCVSDRLRLLCVDVVQENAQLFFKAPSGQKWAKPVSHVRAAGLYARPPGKTETIGDTSHWPDQWAHRSCWRAEAFCPAVSQKAALSWRKLNALVEMQCRLWCCSSEIDLHNLLRVAEAGLINFGRDLWLCLFSRPDEGR